MQAEFAEFAGWLHQDSGDFRRAQYWLDRALEWTYAVADREMAVYVMARKSQLAGDMHDPVSAVDLAEAAITMAVPGSRLQATARTYEAHGHALGDGKTACLRALDEARGLVDELKDAQESAWATWLDGAYVDIQRARCLGASESMSMPVRYSSRRSEIFLPATDETGAYISQGKPRLTPEPMTRSKLQLRDFRPWQSRRRPDQVVLFMNSRGWIAASGVGRRYRQLRISGNR